MKLTYKVIENGYEIFEETNLVYPIIGQGGIYGDYIPYPVIVGGAIDLALSAQAHIEAFVEQQEEQEKSAREEEEKRIEEEEKQEALLVNSEYTVALLEMMSI